MDPTFSGTAGFNVRQSSSLTVTAGASNVVGVTFTPPFSSAVYLITAVVMQNQQSASGTLFQLTDGSTVINAGGQSTLSAGVQSTTLSGIYVPGTPSPVTVKVQVAATNGTAIISNNSNSLVTPVEFTITQLPQNIISSVSSSLIGAMVTYGIYS